MTNGSPQSAETATGTAGLEVSDQGPEGIAAGLQVRMNAVAALLPDRYGQSLRVTARTLGYNLSDLPRQLEEPLVEARYLIISYRDGAIRGLSAAAGSTQPLDIGGYGRNKITPATHAWTFGEFEQAANNFLTQQGPERQSGEGLHYTYELCKAAALQQIREHVDALFDDLGSKANPQSVAAALSQIADRQAREYARKTNEELDRIEALAREGSLNEERLQSIDMILSEIARRGLFNRDTALAELVEAGLKPTNEGVAAKLQAIANEYPGILKGLLSREARGWVKVRTEKAPKDHVFGKDAAIDIGALRAEGMSDQDVLRKLNQLCRKMPDGPDRDAYLTVLNSKLRIRERTKESSWPL